MTENVFEKKCIWSVIWLFSLFHIPLDYMERVGFMTYNATSPLRAIETLWLHFSRLKQHTCNRHNKIFACICLLFIYLFVFVYTAASFLSWILYWHLLNASSTAYCEWSSLTLAASHQILSFVFLLFVCFPLFHTKHIVYGHSWNQSVIFLCCWWRICWFTAGLLHLHHDCPRVHFCCVIFLNGGSGGGHGFTLCTWRPSIIALDLWHGCCRSSQFVSSLQQGLFYLSFHHSVWTFWDIANSLSTLD